MDIRIVFLDTLTVADLPDELARFGKLGSFTAYEATAPGRVVERARHAQVVITNKVVLGADELSRLPELRLVCIAATGMNNVDLAAAAARGIPVRNVAGYSTESVAQLTLALFFNLSMDLPHLNRAVYDGTYTGHGAFGYWRRPFRELNALRWGIVGMGAIGRRTAALVSAFGAEVVHYATSGRPAGDDDAYPRVSFAELLAGCDVISVHCPLTPQTRGLFDYAALRRLRPTAYLINVARGGVVHEEDLVRALDEGRLAGAASDVYTTEPLPADHPYLSVAEPHRLLLTPHMGWASVGARTALLAGVRQNIVDWAARAEDPA